jgi:predicted nuclease with TOPRIM domain
VNLSALQSDYDSLNARLEEEAEVSSNLRNQLSKISADYAALKMRFDKELAAKTEELEETR